MGQNIGYARVSTNDQDLCLQITELKAAGCEPIFTDHIRASSILRPHFVPKFWDPQGFKSTEKDRDGLK